MIKDQFFESALNYTSNNNLLQSFWKEIQDHYQEANRHYHNLEHLNNFLIELLEVKSMIKNWDALVFALVYHDIIQDAGAGKNEKQSADLANKRLSQINFQEKSALLTQQAILSTSKHEVSVYSDINFFIDADLYILGKAWATYQKYIKDIRNEYSNVPDSFFYSGRKRILLKLLKMPSIYKTVHFQEKYEKKARINLEKELESMP